MTAQKMDEPVNFSEKLETRVATTGGRGVKWLWKEWEGRFTLRDVFAGLGAGGPDGLRGCFAQAPRGL